MGKGVNRASFRDSGFLGFLSRRILVRDEVQLNPQNPAVQRVAAVEQLSGYLDASAAAQAEEVS